MTRLIDADALTDNVDKYIYRITRASKRKLKVGESAILADIKAHIELSPTIDAVPVIRCYECKYFTEFEKGFASDWDGSCRYWNTHSTVYSNFCGCGARMDEERK